MKYLNFNKILLGVALAGISLSGCKKVIVPEDLGSRGQKIIGIIGYGSLAPAAYTASSLALDLSAPVETVEMSLRYSGPTVFGNDMMVTLGYDAAALAAFNASVPPGGLTYVALPSNFYRIVNPTIKIPKGTAISEDLVIEIFADMLDPAVSYMFPITITAITGAPSDVVKAPATSTAYLHIIGNPIAGNYTWDFYRWNNETGTGANAGGTFFGDVVGFSAVDPNHVTVPTGYFIQPNYVISFSGSGNALTDFEVEPSAGMLADWDANGITITEQPHFLIADPVAEHYKVQMIVWNGAAFRFLIDDYYR
jgi:hypothetical protein